MATVRKVIGIDDQGKAHYEGVYPCCWADCVRPGDTKHQLVVPNGKNEYTGLPQTLTYVFCCEMHMHYYRNSHKDLNNLPSGYRPGAGVLRY
jgi:hypothetical protein